MLFLFLLHRLFRRSLLGYRVQGDERFHSGLLPVDADEPPPLCRRPDRARMELLDVGLGKFGEIGEDECTPAQFRTSFIEHKLANRTLHFAWQPPFSAKGV